MIDKKILFLSFTVAILASFFASTNPDGLDKTTGSLGFANCAVEQKSLFTGYSLPLIKEGKISAALAGVLGVLLVFAIFWFINSISKKSKNK
jgi:hypothetical protein